MASQLNLTEFDAYMKELYTDERIFNLAAKKNPMWALLRKSEDFYGDVKPTPLKYGNPQGRSRTFSNAKANREAGKRTKFNLTRVKDYGYITIDNETIEASQSNKGAFYAAKADEIDGMLDELAHSLALSCFRDTSGFRGQVNAEPAEAATTVITLKSTADVHNFEVGQTIVVYSAKTGGSQRIYDTSVTNAQITAVNRSSGVITLDEAYTSNGTIAADDYLFIEGDRGASVAGLLSWLPTTAPTSGDNFFGVDRSADTDRLAGVRVSQSGAPHEEVLVDCIAELELRGARPDYCFVPFGFWKELEKSLGSRVQYIDVSVANIGFRGIQIQSNQGPVTVLADRNCPAGYAFMLQMDTWKWEGLGKAPRIFDGDGNMSLRETDNDGIEVRSYYYGNLACRAPGYNAVITLD